MTCNTEDCNAPNRCDQICGTCNNTSCQAEPCADPECPVSFSHFDLCYEQACAPSSGSTPCSPALCELGNCDGTFVTNTCDDVTHRGWDPNCPNSLVSPVDVVHNYQGMPPPSNTYSQGLLQSQAFAPQNGHYQQNPYTNDSHGSQIDSGSWSQFGVFHSSSSQNQSTPSLSPATSTATLYDPAQWSSPVASRLATSRKRGADCCKPHKRQRVSSEFGRGFSQTPESLSSDNPAKARTSAPAGEISVPDTPTESICRWIVNPEAPVESRQECLYIAASPEDLHNHLIKAHTSQLNSHTRFHCRWSDCTRFLTADYGQKSKLKRHLLTHSLFLPYPCSHQGCNKSFSTNDQRRNHEATHTDERKYVCDWPGCGAKFRHATSLSTHKYTHTGEKPYVCWICGHREGDPSNKSKHMKREHPYLPRQRPIDWDEEKTKRELEAQGYSWPPGGCKLNDGCDK